MHKVNYIKESQHSREHKKYKIKNIRAAGDCAKDQQLWSCYYPVLNTSLFSLALTLLHNVSTSMQVYLVYGVWYGLDPS